MLSVTTAQITDAAALAQCAAGSLLVIRSKVHLDDLIDALERIRDDAQGWESAEGGDDGDPRVVEPVQAAARRPDLHPVDDEA
jgi:hypothetical protein